MKSVINLLLQYFVEQPLFFRVRNFCVQPVNVPQRCLIKIRQFVKSHGIFKQTGEIPEIGVENHGIGSRFAKTIEKLGLSISETGIFREYLDARKGKAVNHCCIYGVFCAQMEISMGEALAHYLYAQTSAMVTNCVKTIPLSQTAGQQLLSGCYKEFGEILEDVMHKSKEDLCLSAPGFDIRGIQHEKLYSRLYMS